MAKARGLRSIAGSLGLGRVCLYKAMAPGAKPRYDTLKKFHEEQTAVIVRNTEGALKDRFPTERPTVKGCEKMIGAISDGSMDFAKKAEFYETLQNINTEITALGAK